MREIIETPCKMDLKVIGVKGNKPLNFLKKPNGHFLIEYEGNWLKSAIDLDSIGLGHIKTVEELDKFWEERK